MQVVWKIVIFDEYLECPNSSLVHVFEPLFWTGQLLGTLRLKAQTIFNADPPELQVTWRSVYNDVVWLYDSYLQIERYL